MSAEVKTNNTPNPFVDPIRFAQSMCVLGMIPAIFCQAFVEAAIYGPREKTPEEIRREEACIKRFA